MIYRAEAEFTRRLISLPETGMGYQIITAKKEGSYFSEEFVVLNAQLIINIDDDFFYNQSELRNKDFDELIKRADYKKMAEISSVHTTGIRSNFILQEEITFYSKGRHKGGNSALKSPKINASGQDNFVRLSAYSDDKRIDFENRCLKPGSFTTSDEDYKTCKGYNDDAIDRYALPNDETISWAYYFLPCSSDLVQPGIVQPANEHQGGGIEAFFDKGTEKGTFIERKSY